MRELKFRAWVKPEQRMIGVYEMTFIDNEFLIISDGMDFYTNDEFKLMQFTGLKDKNGKEIYEGDIIKCSDGHDYYFGVVAYDKDYGNFGVSEDNDEDMDPFGYLFEWKNVEELEVVGSKYENPELLKGE
ncbi:phage uncharacterized protein TIGR01671 [Streptococcus equinus]|uniref:Phage uncharacterized protein TIGR01671 n=1 Tax=Streptococcus equinus TaxID=1335 RepID=A0A239RFR6_STREI|nr:YopX family protein [Streptococcus equinus]SNU09713.1 phage uncharacterized protein TIGR01671 [Streptococcus equinus]